MRLLQLVLASLLVSASPLPVPQISQTITRPSPYTLTDAVIPRLVCLSPLGDIDSGKGSGVRISDDLVITARHVVRSQQSHLWRNCAIDGKLTKTVYDQIGVDFVVVKADMPEGFRANISCEGIRAGERYVAIGYQHDGYTTFEPLTGTDEVNVEHEATLIGKVYHGMSGGAVVKEATGQVVAITVATDVDGRPYAYAVPLSATYLCK